MSKDAPAAEREEIFNIHLRKRGRDPVGYDVNALARQARGYSGAEIMQLRVGKGCPWLGRKLLELDFPPNAVIGAVIKKGQVVTPGGKTVLKAGDEVVVFALPDALDAVAEFFAGGEP